MPGNKSGNLRLDRSSSQRCLLSSFFHHHLGTILEAASNPLFTTAIFSVSADSLMSGDLRVLFTYNIHFIPESIQCLSISNTLSIHTLTIPNIGSYVYSVHPDIGWLSTVLHAVYCYSVHPDIGWVPTVRLSYTATVCTLILAGCPLCCVPYTATVRTLM